MFLGSTAVGVSNPDRIQEEAMMGELAHNTTLNLWRESKELEQRQRIEQLGLLLLFLSQLGRAGSAGVTVTHKGFIAACDASAKADFRSCSSKSCNTFSCQHRANTWSAQSAPYFFMVLNVGVSASALPDCSKTQTHSSGHAHIDHVTTVPRHGRKTASQKSYKERG